MQGSHLTSPRLPLLSTSTGFVSEQAQTGVVLLGRHLLNQFLWMYLAEGPFRKLHLACSIFRTKLCPEKSTKALSKAT